MAATDRDGDDNRDDLSEKDAAGFSGLAAAMGAGAASSGAGAGGANAGAAGTMGAFALGTVAADESVDDQGDPINPDVDRGDSPDSFAGGGGGTDSGQDWPDRDRNRNRDD